MMREMNTGASVGAAAACGKTDSARHGNERSAERLGSAAYPPGNVAQEESPGDRTAASASPTAGRTSCGAYGSTEGKDHKG